MPGRIQIIAMIRIFCLLFVFSVTMLGACGLRGHDGTGAARSWTFMDEYEVKEHASWVEKRLKMDVGEPAVLFAGDVLRMIQGDDEMHALHLPGLIIMDEKFWNSRRVLAQSFLVHELIHRGQMNSGRNFECRGQREFEAYMGQNLWLIDKGQIPYVDEFTLRAKFGCQGEGS